jgi:hypothetical protein
MFDFLKRETNSPELEKEMYRVACPSIINHLLNLHLRKHYLISLTNRSLPLKLLSNVSGG